MLVLVLSALGMIRQVLCGFSHARNNRVDESKFFAVELSKQELSGIY